MPKATELNIPVNVSGSALRVLALTKAVEIVMESPTLSSKDRISIALDAAARFEAYLTGKSADDDSP